MSARLFSVSLNCIHHRTERSATGAGPAAAQLPAKAISSLAGDASHIHYAKASYRWAGAKVAAAKAFADPYPRHN